MQQPTLTAALLASLPDSQRAAILTSFTDAERAALRHHWPFWARPEQLPPAGNWRTWLILAGRGWGKTRTGAEWVRSVKDHCPRIALIAETAADARDVLVEGESGILACSPPWDRPNYEPSKRRLTWPNGAIATTYSAEEPDSLRGPQHGAAWLDELAKYRDAQELFDMASLGLRLGDQPRAIITTTPRPHPLLKQLMADPSCVVTRGRTLDNSANLPEQFLASIIARYQGTRLGRQELDAEFLDDTPGALWTRAMIEAARVTAGQAEQLRRSVRMRRVVVGVDPSGSAGEGEGAAQGIITAALGQDGKCYVLNDASCELTPEQWARVVVDQFDRFGADRIVAERNFGGDMVAATIRTARPSAPVKLVTASRGKHVRAEPIAALYEQGRVMHLGAFPALEDEMCAMTATGYTGSASPDRLDALVWALTELALPDRVGEARTIRNAW